MKHCMEKYNLNIFNVILKVQVLNGHLKNKRQKIMKIWHLIVRTPRCSRWNA